MAKNLGKTARRNRKKTSKIGTPKRGHKGVLKRKVPRPSVLIVDDDDSFRDSLAALFRREGFDVFDRAAVFPSIESIRKKSFDVVVLDMLMPERTGEPLRQDAGLLTTQSLKQYADMDKTTILVVFTGYPSVQHCFAAIDAGAYYLPKCVFDVDRNLLDMSAELVQECKRLIAKRREEKIPRPWLEGHYRELMERFPGRAVAILEKSTDTGGLKTTILGQYKIVSAPTVKQLKDVILRNPALRKAMPLILDIWKEDN